VEELTEQLALLQVTGAVLGNKDLLELCLAPLGGFELLDAACVSKAWRDAARRSPLWLVFAGVDSERKLRFACGLGGATVVLRPGVEITLSGIEQTGLLLLADGTTLRGGIIRGHGLRSSAVSRAAGTALLAALQSNRALTALNARDTPLLRNANEHHREIQLLLQLPALRAALASRTECCDLADRGLGDEGAERLAVLLLRPEFSGARLRINLRRNEIKGRGGRALEAALRELQLDATIVHLDLKAALSGGQALLPPDRFQ